MTEMSKRILNGMRSEEEEWKVRRAAYQAAKIKAKIEEKDALVKVFLEHSYKKRKVGDHQGSSSTTSTKSTHGLPPAAQKLILDCLYPDSEDNIMSRETY